MSNRIINVHWEGPMAWKEALKQGRKKGYVLYQIYGSHPVHGSDILLFIGKTKQFSTVKLEEHVWWTLHEEYDRVEVRLGSVGQWFDWEHWLKKRRSNVYPAPNRELMKKLSDIENLLILANQPLYNTQYKNEQGVGIENEIRIFNTGQMGRIMPEVSTDYFAPR